MKFACVEFNTKSGDIWRPTPDKPNYLCDPDKEIDSCAWGTWTSALNGEHIPLHWFIKGKKGKGASKRESFFNRGLKKIKRWIRMYNPNYKNIDYIKRFDVVLVCHHFYYNIEMTHFLKEAKKTSPKTIFLGTTAYNLGRIREFWHNPLWFSDFKMFADSCDIYINLNRVADEYYKLVTDTPVVYFPMFYPYEYGKNYFVNLEQKEKSIFVAGDTSRIDNLMSQLIARKIQEQYPEYIIKVTKMPKMNTEPLKECKYEIIPFVQWQGYLEQISKMYLVINMDAWWTKGRTPGDAACVGSPCIGINADSQMELFPDLACRDIIDTKKAVELGIILISDKEFYRIVQQKAIDRLSEYSYEKSRKRLENLIILYKEKRLKDWNPISWKYEY